MILKQVGGQGEIHSSVLPGGRGRGNWTGGEDSSEPEMRGASHGTVSPSPVPTMTLRLRVDLRHAAGMR